MSTGPLPPGRAWAASGVVAAAVLAAVASIGPLLQPGPWRATTAVSVVLVLVVTATARAVTGQRWAPTAWGTAAAVGILAVLYSGPSGASAPLPTLGTLRGLTRTAEQGVAAVVGGYIPLETVRGVEMLLVGGALVIALAVDLLAIGLGRAGLGGLPLLALWAVPVVFERTPSALTLGTTGVAYLLLLALSRPTTATPRRTQDGARTVATATAVTAVAVLAGAALPALPGWDAVRLPQTWGHGGPGTGSVQLALDLDMRASLGPRSDRPVLSYTTRGLPSPGPLRLSTLTAFDGREWAPEPPGAAPDDAGGLLWPEPVGTEDEPGLLSIRVGDLDQDRLPLPLEPRSLRLPSGGGWRYDPQRDEVLSRSTTTRDLAYDVEVTPRDLSADRLRTDSARPVEPDSPYLAVPDTPAAEQVRQVAESLAADATTTYDVALALQSYFRDTSTFRYDTRVPAAASDDAVHDFLQQRVGYCVQYATAMTVMARHLGIPARMGVGFLPGRADPTTGSFVVTARLAHTWPELWFEEAGWVRFEPTPAAQTGAPPVYADPLVQDPLRPDEQVPTAGATPPTTSPTPTPTSPGSGGVTGEVPLGGLRVPVPAVLALAAVLVLTTLVVRARRRPEPEWDPETAWALAWHRLGARGLDWDPAETPRRAADRVAPLLRSGDPASPTAGRDGATALAQLAAAVEQQRYAPNPPSLTHADLRRLVEEITASTRSTPVTPAQEPAAR